MNDVEMTKLCGDAMGYQSSLREDGTYGAHWNPLRNDGQAMALVRKLRLTIYGHNRSEDEWAVYSGWRTSGDLAASIGSDLNRAIVEYVAKYQSSISKGISNG